jgi:dihydropteroate synthase
VARLTPAAPLRCGRATFFLSGPEARTIIMGVLNVTPDSFSDGGQFIGEADEHVHNSPTRAKRGSGEFVDVRAAVAHARALVEAGADVIDVGGESTRPGAAPVAVDVELARVIPVVEALVHDGIDAISVDTRHPDVARAALQAGARWVNDVNALRADGMIDACAGADAVILMHWQHALSASSESPTEDRVDDDDIVATVGAFLAERVAAVVGAGGISADRVVVDPGIGFGKTVQHNLALTRALGPIRTASGAAAIMYGPSRKRFLGAITGRDVAADRDVATVGAVCAAVACGADIVRVHNVAAVKDAVVVADAIVRGAAASL